MAASAPHPPPAHRRTVSTLQAVTPGRAPTITIRFPLSQGSRPAPVRTPPTPPAEARNGLPPHPASDIFETGIRPPAGAPFRLPLHPARTGGPLQSDRIHRRSMGFLELDGETWACFLVTYPAVEGGWRGHFSFRAGDGETDGEEVRTTEIFLEDSEDQIDRKARGLGRPLLSGLLSSALHTRERADGTPPRLRKWFRSVLRANAREISGEWEEDGHAPSERPAGELRSIYASYRLDQVAHFITLVRSEDFEEAVSRILEGEVFDFGAKDRLQFAMMVIDFIERHLPLPPFEVWAEDYLSHPEQYRLYTHTLHRSGRLP